MTPHLSLTKGAAAAALAMLLASSLGGCSSQSQSQGNAAPSASASVSASASGEGGSGSTGEPEAAEIETPELPKRPAAMDRDDEEGAIAAAEHFLRLSLYGAATGDWAEYDAMSMDTCTFCENYKKANQEAYEAGKRSSNTEMSVVESGFGAWPDDASCKRVDLLVERGAHARSNVHGTSEDVEAETSVMAFVECFEDAWRVLELEALDPDEYDVFAE